MTQNAWAGGPPSRPFLDTARFWAGGAATALVAGLIALVGVLIAQGVFGIDDLSPDGTAIRYALVAACAGIIASGLAQLLVMFTPRPMRFFGWVMALSTTIATLVPFATRLTRGAELAVAAINLVLGIAIGSLVSGTVRASLRTPRLDGRRDV